MAKLGTKKEITVEGKEYVLQHPGMKYAVELRDKCKNDNGVLQESKYYESLMNDVVFLKDGGKTNWDYWEENEGFAEVMKETALFLNK